MYSGVDPASLVGEALLKTPFVAKSWGAIRKKLEKLDDWQDLGLQELLREAQKVYVWRDEAKRLRPPLGRYQNVIIVERRDTLRESAESGCRMKRCLGTRNRGVRGSICWGLEKEQSP